MYHARVAMIRARGANFARSRRFLCHARDVADRFLDGEVDFRLEGVWGAVTAGEVAARTAPDGIIIGPGRRPFQTAHRR